MKTRYKILSVVAVYLIGNALLSTSVGIFFAHLMGHFFLALFAFVILGLIYIIIPDDIDRLLAYINRQVSSSMQERKMQFNAWWNKPRPLLDTTVDLLTSPIARQRLIREANTGQYELQLEE